MKMIYLMLLLSCSTVEQKDPAPADISLVKEKLETLHEEAGEDSIYNGWMLDGCDSMLFQGKYQATAGALPLDPRTAQLSGEAGRFFRRGSKPCNLDGKDVGSKTTWSRDMGIGLIYWAYRTKNLSVLADHFNYGKAHNWQMGKPLDDGRVIYTPNIISLLSNAIVSLGGSSSLHQKWPTIYPSGLKSYQAHLQVLQIALRGEIATNKVDKPQKPEAELNMSISGSMYRRLEEHSKREPKNPLYQAVYGKYSGDMQPAIDACLDGYTEEDSRCGTEEHGCQIAEIAFACDFVIRVFEGK